MCWAAAHVPLHLPLRGPRLYILLHLLLVRVSKGLAHLRDRAFDAKHPTINPMYTMTTPQAPSAHMLRPRAYAIGHKVNSLLSKPSLSTHETWLLPHAWTLHILRNNRDDHGGSKDQGQAWKRRRKKKQGQASGKPGTSGRNLPGTSGLPACKDSGRSPCNLFPTYPFVA